MKTKLYLDLDDVVFDTENHLRQVLGGEWLEFKGLVYTEYEVMSVEERIKVANVLADYSSIPYVEGAIKGMSALLDNYNIIFYTTSQSRFETISKMEYADWVGMRIIICGEDKSGTDMSGSVYVDNRGDHLNESNADVKVCFYKEGCSKPLDSKVKMVYNWVDLVDYLINL